ncbi:hypothetical protein F4X33_03025 [Candidatus Poribacteria bacterium]|nr:hypothetical protein [Candidatus Poribacteria bacterium]
MLPCRGLTLDFCTGFLARGKSIAHQSFGVFFQSMIRQEWDIFMPVSKWGNHDGESGDPIDKIRPESTRFYRTGIIER